MDFSEEFRFLLPISTRKNDALLMLYQTETLDLLPPDALLLLILSVKKGVSDRAPWRKHKKKSPKSGLFKPFLGLLVWQGQ